MYTTSPGQEDVNAKNIRIEKETFFGNSLHGFSMYMLHFIHIRYDNKREQKRRRLRIRKGWGNRGTRERVRV